MSVSVKRYRVTITSKYSLIIDLEYNDELINLSFNYDSVKEGDISLDDMLLDCLDKYCDNIPQTFTSIYREVVKHKKYYYKVAITNTLIEYINRNNRRGFTKLLTKESGLLSELYNSKPLIHFIILSRNIYIMKDLLSFTNIIINQKDQDGKTALMISAIMNNKSYLSTLLDDFRTDTEIKDNNGNTALFYSLKAKSHIKLLVEAGCSLTVKNTCCNNTVFSMLLSKSMCDTCKKFLSRSRGNLDKYNYLIEYLNNKAKLEIGTFDMIFKHHPNRKSLYSELYPYHSSLDSLIARVDASNKEIHKKMMTDTFTAIQCYPGRGIIFFEGMKSIFGSLE